MVGGEEHRVRVVVQKFGGRCVESDEAQELSAQRIMEAKDQGLSPVVVVSAMGRAGQPYSTAELVNMVTRINPRIEPRELDLLMCCGEIISAVAMANLLKGKGYRSIAFSGGQAGFYTDLYYGHAEIVKIDPHHLLHALQDRYLIFVAGFQGVTLTDHAVTTLGEGGSDYTAVALAQVFLQTPALPFGDEVEVAPVQIFKEVDGVLTADPKQFCDDSLAQSQKPRQLPGLTYDECIALAYLGAEVFQHKAAIMARRQQIPVIIRNFAKAEAAGTEISPSVPARPPTGSSVTALADTENLLVFTPAGGDSSVARHLPEWLTKERLTFYPVITPRGEMRFAVKREKYRDVRLLVERILFDWGLAAEVSPERWSLVSLVGESMRGRLTQFRERAEASLREGGVEIAGSQEGELSLSYLMPEECLVSVIRRLHGAFIQ